MKNRVKLLGVLFSVVGMILSVVPNSVDAFWGIESLKLAEMLEATVFQKRGISVYRSRKYRGSREDSNFTEGVEKRASRTTTGRRANYYTTNRQISPQQKFKVLGVDNSFGFSIRLPEGFDKKKDTLTPDDGVAEFATSNSSVEIKALGNICMGGPVSVLDCLNKTSNFYTDALEEQYLSGLVLKKEVVKLRDSSNRRFDRENVGKVFIMDVGVEKIGVLTFIDPLMGYLWRMEISSPDNMTGLLNQGGALNKIKESLFVEHKEMEANASRRVTTLKGNNRLRSNYWGRKRNARQVLYSDDNWDYDAQNLAFEVAVPKSFHLVSDSLQRHEGELKFKNGEGEILIKATRDVCVSETQSIVRKCVERVAKDYILDLREANEDKRSLGINNYQLRLTADANRLFAARGDVLMSAANRVGVFVFAEPEYGHVWVVEVNSNKGQTGILGDMRKMKNFLGSLRFL